MFGEGIFDRIGQPNEYYISCNAVFSVHFAICVDIMSRFILNVLLYTLLRALFYTNERVLHELSLCCH